MHFFIYMWRNNSNSDYPWDGLPLTSYSFNDIDAVLDRDTQNIYDFNNNTPRNNYLGDTNYNNTPRNNYLQDANFNTPPRNNYLRDANFNTPPRNNYLRDANFNSAPRNNYLRDTTNTQRTVKKIPEIQLMGIDEIRSKYKVITKKTDVEMSGIAKDEYFENMASKYQDEITQDRALVPHYSLPQTYGTNLFTQKLFLEHPAMAMFIVGAVGKGKSSLVKWCCEILYRMYHNDSNGFAMNIFSSSESTFYGKFVSKPITKVMVKSSRSREGKVKYKVDKQNSSNRLEKLYANILAEKENNKDVAGYKFKKRILILDDVLGDILSHKDTYLAIMDMLKNRYWWNLTIFITNQNFVGLRSTFKAQMDMIVFVSMTSNVYAKREFNKVIAEEDQEFVSQIFKSMHLKNYVLVYKRDIDPRSSIYFDTDKEYKEKRVEWFKTPICFAVSKDFMPKNVTQEDEKRPYNVFFNNKLAVLRDKHPKIFRLGYIEKR